MRTINLPTSTAVAPYTPGVRIRFVYRFGKPYQGLGRHYSQINSIDDEFRYSRDCFSPAALETAVARYAAPDRDVKAFIFCEITVGRYAFGGISFCYTGDAWSRLIGERLALRRALEQMERMEGTTGLQLSSDVRKRMWEAWLASYKAAAVVWTDTPPTATGQLRKSEPAIQELPRKPADISASVLALLALLKEMPLPPVYGLRRPFSF